MKYHSFCSHAKGKIPGLEAKLKDGGKQVEAQTRRRDSAQAKVVAKQKEITELGYSDSLWREFDDARRKQREDYGEKKRQINQNLPAVQKYLEFQYISLSKKSDLSPMNQFSAFSKLSVLI